MRRPNLHCMHGIYVITQRLYTWTRDLNHSDLRGYPTFVQDLGGLIELYITHPNRCIVTETHLMCEIFAVASFELIIRCTKCITNIDFEPALWTRDSRLDSRLDANDSSSLYYIEVYCITWIGCRSSAC